MSAPTPFNTQIAGEEINGWVSKDGRSFRAHADFRGDQIVARGRTASAAVSAWRDIANHMANE